MAGQETKGQELKASCSVTCNKSIGERPILDAMSCPSEERSGGRLYGLAGAQMAVEDVACCQICALFLPNLAGRSMSDEGKAGVPWKWPARKRKDRN
ncbi:hypothetical protein HPB48_023516 [Haemaphysalis longicornis]|uniref:Uncharacterized protein n=1 Tax=Haemaphysalis longicornis TaxID=44386 RepID=A0A9J6H743_HAELO|nr:hypothetical protein HPB48_023516 [Haemaphysalis longicornis]